MIFYAAEPVIAINITDVENRLKDLGNVRLVYKQMPKSSGLNSVASNEMKEKILYGQRQFDKIGNSSNRIINFVVQ